MKADGGDIQRLTDHAGSDYTPCYSPDGNKVAYTSDKSGNRDIWVKDLKTGQDEQITDYPGRDYYPSFSPDGSIIAYVSGDIEKDGTGNLEIFTYHIDTKTHYHVTKNKGIDRFVSWSPDGKYLIYCGAKEGKAERLTILEYATGKHKERAFDRTLLDKEVGVQSFHIPIVSDFFPESIRRLSPHKNYYGYERYPDWKA